MAKEKDKTQQKKSDSNMILLFNMACLLFICLAVLNSIKNETDLPKMKMVTILFAAYVMFFALIMASNRLDYELGYFLLQILFIFILIISYMNGKNIVDDILNEVSRLFSSCISIA